MKPSTAVGLFPTASDDTGGVQLSGKIADAALESYFGSGWQRVSVGPTQTPFKNSLLWKGKAVYETLRISRSQSCIIVWHLGLLPLASLVRGKARTVLFLHGVEAWQVQPRWVKRLLERVDLFLTNSDFTWSRFIAIHPSLEEKPHQTIQLGLNDVSSTLDGSPSSPPYILMVGRLNRKEKYKGHAEVIRSWPRVLEAVPDAQLKIAGQGDLLLDLRALAHEVGAMEHISFLGFVTEEQKLDLFFGCSGFALPSMGEGFGLVYLEAMRAGRPCLVSTLDAGREVVNPPEAGLAVDPRNERELTRSLIELLTRNAKWDKMARTARARYTRLFTEEGFRERLLGALQENGLAPP